MASYNTWMNTKLYQAAGELSASELSENKGAFFGSVLGILNHLVVADRIWLQRFSEHPSRHEALSDVRLLPKPQALNEILFADFKELSEHRRMLDAVIERWVGSLTEADMDQAICYANSKGVRFCRRFPSLVLHFFNHQTHHRGQATTLLSQFGKDVGVTDLLALLPNELET
ncbi:MAG: DinB family protein [Steroidobacter sp.]|nr:DinB family protein [Steroidobacter sp.]